MKPKCRPLAPWNSAPAFPVVLWGQAGMAPVEAIHMVFFQRWPSGLRRSPEKRVEVKASRGFESRPLC